MNNNIEDTSQDIEFADAEQIIQTWIGNQAGNARIGIGHFLLIEFGELTTRVLKPTRFRKEEKIIQEGEWGLWLYSCQWRIVHNGSLLTNSLSESKQEMENIVAHINGSILESVVISSPFFDATFTFSNGYKIETLSISKDSRHWLLRTPNGKFLGFGPDSNLYYRY